MSVGVALPDVCAMILVDGLGNRVEGETLDEVEFADLSFQLVPVISHSSGFVCG